MSTDIKGGLSVQRNSGTAPGWVVVHITSGLKAINALHYKKDACAARDELLATGYDFTLEPKSLRAQEGFAATVYPIFLRWDRMRLDPPYIPAQARMTFMAQRNRDGLIHITNTIMGRTGQHHVHDQASFEDWKGGSPKIGPVPDADIVWLAEGTKDCACGQKIWKRAS